MTSTTELVEQLRAGARHHGDHVRAAVELLIWHETWPRRRDFVSAAVIRSAGQAYIRWSAAAEFVESRPRASTSELAILDLAVALGLDRYRLANMGAAHRAAIIRAITTAVGA